MRQFFIAALAATAALSALESESFDAEYLAPTNDRGPFTISLHADSIGKAKFDKNELNGNKIGFSYAEADADAVFYYNPCYTEGLNVSAAYTRYNLRWDENPYFDDNRFNYASLSIGGATKRIPCWLWQAQVKINIDTDHFDISEYANYNLLLWGRYEYLCNAGFHAGFIAFTGMRIDKIFPIIGFDWQINPCWKLNVVYPVNMSAVYTYDCNWSFEAAMRFFYFRGRADKDEPLPMALWEYRNTGAEIGLNYDIGSKIHINLHAGYAAGGQLKISNKRHKHPDHLDFNGSGYAGAELAWNF